MTIWSRLFRTTPTLVFVLMPIILFPQTKSSKPVPGGRKALAADIGKSGRASPYGQPAPDLDKPGGVEPSSRYRIGPGDVLQISVWKEPQASVPSVVVPSDGRLSLPLVKEVTVLGLTVSDLERVLSQKYSQFLEVPEVSVIVKEIYSQKIYVVGGVHKPGSIQLRSPMTVLQVLAEAGGLSDYAKKGDIFVIRNEAGKQIRLRFDYNAQLKGRKDKPDFSVRPGDTVVVPQ